MAIYQGKKITAVRPAKQGDQDFAQGKDQVVITLPDGTEKTVPKSEVAQQDQDQASQQGQQGRQGQSQGE